MKAPTLCILLLLALKGMAQTYPDITMQDYYDFYNRSNSEAYNLVDLAEMSHLRNLDKILELNKFSKADIAFINFQAKFFKPIEWDNVNMKNVTITPNNPTNNSKYWRIYLATIYQPKKPGWDFEPYYMHSPVLFTINKKTCVIYTISVSGSLAGYASLSILDKVGNEWIQRYPLVMSDGKFFYMTNVVS